MIVDVILFYNELEMLEYRLETLYPVVDKFVIVEATRTFRGNPKPLLFSNNFKNTQYLNSSGISKNLNGGCFPKILLREINLDLNCDINKFGILTKYFMKNELIVE